MEKEKPSFFDSITDGMWGFVKGALTGGVIGVLAGAAVAAVAALIAPDTIGTLLGNGSSVIGETGTFLASSGLAAASELGPIASASLIGGSVGGVALATVGGFSGMATEVVRGREAAQISGEDVANVAKISYAQGMMVGHNIAQEQQAEVSTKFRDRIAQERAGRTTQQQVN